MYNSVVTQLLTF